MNILDEFNNIEYIHFPHVNNSPRLTIYKSTNNNNEFENLKLLFEEYKSKLIIAQAKDTKEETDYKKKINLITKKNNRMMKWNFVEISEYLKDEELFYYIENNEEILIKEELIKYLIKSGYIDEDYNKYITLNKIG